MVFWIKTLDSLVFLLNFSFLFSVDILFTDFVVFNICCREGCTTRKGGRNFYSRCWHPNKLTDSCDFHFTSIIEQFYIFYNKFQRRRIHCNLNITLFYSRLRIELIALLGDTLRPMNLKTHNNNKCFTRYCKFYFKPFNICIPWNWAWILSEPLYTFYKYFIHQQRITVHQQIVLDFNIYRDAHSVTRHQFSLLVLSIRFDLHLWTSKR